MRIQVTIVQRSATCVTSTAAAEATHFKLPFSTTAPVGELDFFNNSIPTAFLLQLMKSGVNQHVKMLDKELHDGLRKAGFNLTWELSPGSGEVGALGFLYDRGASGTSAITFISEMNNFFEYFIVLDVGCGKLIVEGRVKVRGLSSLFRAWSTFLTALRRSSRVKTSAISRKKGLCLKMAPSSQQMLSF